MDRTSADQFRSNMKEWMEAARSEPVKITRKSGEAFVLLNADIFAKMQLDLARLQGLTASLMDVAQGRVTPANEKSTADVFAHAKERALATKRAKTKKAVG
jgi:PHD/YefM family antitoxin component YafN of YafNO toxin-antitoxin module